jgi:OFA family oxalate/formate antiporter-like MFS transporter
VLGVGALVLVTTLAQFLANPPAGYVPGTDSARAVPGGERTGEPVSAPTPTEREEYDWTDMLKTGRFYLLWIMFILGASAGLMIIAHVAIIGKEQAGLQWGFMPVAILAILNTFGRVLSGYLSDRIGRTQTMVLAFSLQAVNMFAFPFYTTPALLIFGSAFTGLCYGTLFTLMPAAIADGYGTRNLGVNYGILFTAFGVAGVVGPILGGYIRDTTGSYRSSFVFSAILLVVGAGLAFVGPRTSGRSTADERR